LDIKYYKEIIATSTYEFHLKVL